VSNPTIGEQCCKGVLCWEATLVGKLYEELWKRVFQSYHVDQRVVLEIAESDYEKRIICITDHSMDENKGFLCKPLI